MIRIESVWLAVEPLDMRAGTDSALASVVHVFEARPHHAYLFANRRADRMKVLVRDGIGVWLAARRLNSGKFVWPKNATATAALSRAQASPHRPFVVSLVREVRELTTHFHSAAWYTGLLKAAGITRRPSSRTFSLALVSAKDAAGEAIGPTLASVKELRRQMTGMVGLMADLKNQVSKIAESARRQDEIGQGLAKRQLVFQDQSQLYQRQIEELTAIVQSSLRQAGKEVDRLSKAAADITLDSHRLSANIQQAARGISEAADRLASSSRS